MIDNINLFPIEPNVYASLPDAVWFSANMLMNINIIEIKKDITLK
jgi:hypothetical protein